jgi:hypothetical protein
MQQRIEAMISAVALVRPPLEKSYGLLDDDRKRGLMRSPKISARHPLQKHRLPRTVPLRSPPHSSGRAASSRPSCT